MAFIKDCTTRRFRPNEEDGVVKVKFVRILILLIFVILGIEGCSNSSEPDQINRLVREYFLSDTTGIRTTSFNVEEDIIFNYLFINFTRDSLIYGTAYDGPLVIFSVFRDTISLGTTAYESAFPYAPRYILPPGDTIRIRHSWLLFEENDNLSPGDYSAVAELLLSFKDSVWDRKESIEFTVIN